ncbi:hypothetical protein PG996_004042 [Apiospora saccharicola]|uniref:Extracellular membrane protein CFEM domain-containing protein n=1 Tax=Apiospora saccharicola TaxID=335842 RepID=A0ABR1W493_9PEZI
MDAAIEDRLSRRSGPDGPPTVESAATLDFYSPDPKECVRQCKASFLLSLPGLREGASYEEACQSLTKNQSHELFWDLYCCDSTECGVHIELNPQSLEQSPSVDLIINQCRDIGYDDIYDPGPPQVTCPGVAPLLIPLNASPSTSITSSTSTTAPSASVITTPSALPSETATTDASTTNPTPANAITSKSNKLNSGARAAIGVCAALATVSLAIALFFMRRRRRNTRGYRRTSAAPAQHNTRTDSESTQTAHMPPFLTPPASSSSKTTPSTPPPLRLSDRRYLPPLPPRTTTTATTPPSTPPAESTTSEGSMNASPHTIKISFPRAPASAPTTSRLGPRHERHATTTAQSSIRLGAPNSSSTIPETMALRRSTSSNESGTGRTTLSPLSPSSSLIYPTRPPRPHAGPALEIPDLVTSAGPPPTWALPRPPPTASPSSSTTSSLQLSHRLHPYAPPPLITPPAPAAVPLPLSPILSVSPLSSTRSPTSPAARSPPLSGTPVATTATSPLPPPSFHSISEPQRPHGETVDVLLPSQLPDLRSSRDSVQHGTHVSWGSWSGPGDGKRTLDNNSSNLSDVRSKRGSDGINGRASGVALKKLDLEKLGGSY